MMAPNLAIINFLPKIAAASLLVALHTYSTDTLAGHNQANDNVVKSGASPLIHVAVTPSLIAIKDTAVITWSSRDSNSCSSMPAGIDATSGSLTTPPITTTTSYTIKCIGQTGKTSKSVKIIVAPDSIAQTSAKWAAEPMRNSGNIYYYCDCGAGAQADCVTGNNTNSGKNPLMPRQTIENAVARFDKLAVNDTVALCKGGAFNAIGELNFGNTQCRKGATCHDLREYTPSIFPGKAKPIINKPAGPNQLFKFSGNGGIRIMNLALNGNNGSSSSKTLQNFGFFFYDGAHDVILANLDIDGFNLAIDNESGGGASAVTDNIKVIGNKISNSLNMGYLGGGNNSEINYNYWDENGNDSVFDHTIYIGSHVPLSNIQVVGNYVYGQSSPTCLGAPIVGHVNVDGLEVSGNTVDIEPGATTGGCWGIAFDNGGYPTAISLQNARFSGNTIRNGGNAALTVSNCPGCVIENNLILNETAAGGAGIFISNHAARTAPSDGVSTRNVVRNNTIWYGPNANNGGLGIKLGIEGVGHVAVNNSIYYSATTTGNSGPFTCFNYPLASGAYKQINNNHCYSAARYNWEHTRGSLAAWKKAMPGFDTMSFTENPLYTLAGKNFTPAPGSRLKGSGSTVPNSAPDTDLTGKARSTTPAIGAFE